MARINTRVSLATTLLRRSPLAAFVAATASSSTPPPPIHLRISVALLAPKAFLATAFLMLGRRNVWFYELLWNGILRGVGKRGGCAWAWYVEHGFYIPSRTRKSDLRARLAMSNGRLQLEPSDAGSCFRVGNTKRWIRTSTGESVTGLVMVSLDLEHAHGAQLGGIRAYRSMQSTLAGGSHVAWRTLRVCSKGSAGGLVRGGTCTRRGFECISVAAQARWRSGPDGGTRRRCSTYIAGGRGI